MNIFSKKALRLVIASVLLTNLFMQVSADTGCTFFINQASFDALADGASLELKQAGNYCFTEDCVFTSVLLPNQAELPAIQILANDVIVDFKGFRLRQGNLEPAVVGILIGNPDSVTEIYKNITIKNGSILNFTGAGIFALNAAQFEGAGAYESIAFLDLNILECGSDDSGRKASGIDLDSFANLLDASSGVTNPANIAYRNVTIERCKVNNCRGAGAINIFTGDNVIISGTQANGLLQEAFALNTFGYAIVAQNLQMTNSQGNGTRQEDLAVTTEQVGGAALPNSVGIIVKDCQFNNTFGNSSDLVNGANLSNCRDALFIDTQFNRCRGGSLAGTLNGVHMSDDANQKTDANGIKFINCQFNEGGFDVLQTEPSLKNVAGAYMITVKNIIFERCQVAHIDVDGPAINAYGFFIGTAYADPASPEFAHVRNVLFRDTVVSDISGPSSVLGFACLIAPDTKDGRQGIQTNFVLENCIAERLVSRSQNPFDRIAGIAEYLYYSNQTPLSVSGMFSTATNLYVRGCRISDVRHRAQSVSPVSAGILVESVTNPVLVENSISDCDRGILLSGTNDIIPNAFQLALTPEGAAALKFIDLGAIPLTVTAEIPGGETFGPFPALLASYSPPLTSVITSQGGLADPNNQSPAMLACSPLQVSLNDKVGICRRGGCAFVTKTKNVEAAGAIGTIVVSTGAALVMGGSPTGTYPSVSVSKTDGDIIVNAILNNPEVLITIDTNPSSAQPQVFRNANGTQVNAAPTSVDVDTNFIRAQPEILTQLGWKTGDAITYSAPDEQNPLPGLTSGTTYYAIVYSPGFSECGLIQDNKVTACTISGIQDDRCPTTSAFLSNTAFKNGTRNDHCENYVIHWPGKAPVCKSSLSDIRKCERPFNLSLTAASKPCDRASSKKSKKK